MGRLWDKGYELDALVEEFTVGNDYILDFRLIPADVMGSLAHAVMLESAGLLTPGQLQELRGGLMRILDEHEAGDFTIARGDEDGHTAIENRLGELAGDAGKRIHLGRSRNDQVLTAMRIWMRDVIFHVVETGGRTVGDLLDFAERFRDVPMPGRTHMQPAMPSTAGLWAGGFAEALLDDLRGIAGLYSYFDQCPLGSGAGYGVPLPLDRELTASLLGFSRVQVNVTYGGLSRGKFESRLLEALDQVGVTLSKLAADLILFSLPEFGWFSLPEGLCTGSSIMPQKRNPDALELIRGKAALLGSWAAGVKGVIRSLPSGYNRDYQETKEPTMRGADTLLGMLEVAGLSIRELRVNEGRLRGAFDEGIFATDAAVELAAGGMSFRDAYREVAARSGKGGGSSEGRRPSAVSFAAAGSGGGGERGEDGVPDGRVRDKDEASYGFGAPLEAAAEAAGGMAKATAEAAGGIAEATAEAAAKRTALGSPGNPRFDIARGGLEGLVDENAVRAGEVGAAFEALAGREVVIFTR